MARNDATGVELWTSTVNFPGEAARAARQAETDGFDGISFGDTQCIAGDPFVGLTVAAAATARLKLGVRVTNPATRHPAVVACAIASVQVESGGRAMLGVGRGDSAVSRLGMRASTVAELEEFLERLQGYLSGGAVDADGPDSALVWLAAQPVPKVPVDVAATGPAVIAAGARTAEQVTFNVGADPARLTRAIELAHAPRAAASAPAERLSLGAYVNLVPHPDRRVSHDLIKGPLAAYAHFSGMSGHPVDQLDADDASVVRALGEHYDRSRHARPDAAHVEYLTDDFIDRFGVAGPPDYCIEKLAALVALGLDRLVILGAHPHFQPDRVAESNRLLVDEVIPGVRHAVAPPA